MRRIGAPDIGHSLRRLKRNGFSPSQVFDVGAYQGDFAQLCWDVWPGASVVAFEVLEHKVKQLHDLRAQGRRLDVVPCLLGSERRDSVPFHQLETASSVLKEHVEQDVAIGHFAMNTIDHFVATTGTAPPDLIKIDVQGYELEVLQGAAKTLTQSHVILAELNFLDIHRDVPLIADLLAWLDEIGWVAYDVCGLTRRPFDNALWQADFIFVPRSSHLRQHKGWD